VEENALIVDAFIYSTYSIRPASLQPGVVGFRKGLDSGTSRFLDLVWTENGQIRILCIKWIVSVIDILRLSKGYFWVNKWSY
jgi:hypothetical protein